jgi:molybdate transport system ATP-binding protein
MIHISVRLPLDRFELDVTLDLRRTVTALFGPSGVGKTSLLECVAGLRTPAAGEIRLDGDVLYSSESNIAVPPELRRIGYVPQEALLFPHMSVRRNLTYGSRRRSAAHDGDVGVESVTQALEIEHLLDRAPDTLSGGERQRVALGRALVSGPRLLLLDEPLAALDIELKDRVLPYLMRLRDVYRIPALVVSHDVSEVTTLCDEVVILEGGRLAAQGDPRGVLARAHARRDFFHERFENVFDVRVVKQEPAEGITQTESDGGLRLAIPHAPGELGQRTLIGIFAEDIVLSRSPAPELSARNVFDGTVVSLQERSGVAMVVVRVSESERMYVKLTHRALARLGLEAGAPVQMIFKTHSVHRLD